MAKYEKRFLSMRNKQQVAQHFSRAAKSYDQAATVQHYSSDKLLTLLGQTGVGHCLDLGCGTGTAFSGLLAAGFDQVSGIDLSEQMLMKCQEKIEQNKQQAKISVQCADAEQLPFAEHRFNAVFSNLMVQWSEQPEKLWQELQRVLAPKGLFLFSTLAPNTMQELKQAWQHIDPFVHVNRFLSREQLEQSLTPYFDIVEMQQENYVQHFASLTALLKNLKAIGATNVNSGRNPGLGGREKIRMLEKYYPKDSQGLPLTYDLIWCLARKKK